MQSHEAKRPMQFAEEQLIVAMLDGLFPIGTALPSERDLAVQLGVTRPTLREALRRIELDGWISIQHGKATIVNNFWQEGGLNILGAIIRYKKEIPPEFISNLLKVRLDIAPSYTYLAIQHHAGAIAELLNQAKFLSDAKSFAHFDWQVHRQLAIASENPIYILFLNGFRDFYIDLAQEYFRSSESRDASERYYQALQDAAEKKNPQQAEAVSREAMQTSIALWETSIREKKYETMEWMG